MFFAAGLYGAGLTAYHLGWAAPAAFLAGVVGRARLLARSSGWWRCGRRGVAFMIVTMMFAQACYLLDPLFRRLYARRRGLHHLRSAPAASPLSASPVDLASADVRYNLALALLALRDRRDLRPGARAGRPRPRRHPRERGAHDDARLRHLSLQARSRSSLSGTIAAAAGAAYALLFAYVGATFASIQYSIYPLLWTLLGGAGTVAGPFVGTLLMFYLVDVSSDYTSALSAGGRRRAGAPRPVLPEGHPRDAARKMAAMAAVTLLSHARAEPRASAA